METAVVEKENCGAICEENNPLNPPLLRGNETGIDMGERVAKHIVCKLTAFDKAIAESEILEIDGLAIDGQACDKVTKESKIKVLNSDLEMAFEISVDAIVRQPLKDLIVALETGLFYKLHGVTRIVGYYSKINNWNASKRAELIDRAKGNYWEQQREDVKNVAAFAETIAGGERPVRG